MSSLIQRWENLGLRLRLQLLIQGFLFIALIAAQQWILSEFERQTLYSAEERAIEMGDGTINGLNTLMLLKVGKEDVISDGKRRALFIEKIGISEGIKELRVIRGKGIDDEFDGALPQEKVVDDMDRRVLASGQIEHLVSKDAKGETSLRTVMPFIAKENFRSINCLECHGVDEGTTVGAVSIIIDITNDISKIDETSFKLWVGLIVLQIVLFFVIGEVVRRLLMQLGGEPKHVIDIVRQIAKGNLSGNIETAANDNSSLLFATKQMQAGLKEIIGKALKTSDDLARAARELTASSREVIVASEHQADATVSAAASIEEMTVCVGHIAENAVDANKYASEAGGLAKSGSDAVQSVVAEMGKISEVVTTSSQAITALGEHSNQISNIVKVIKEIADQTNLLALNAAIEAARAGEQGRGFAVVADEVRKLAERTARSTQEITAMIQSIQNGTRDAVSVMSVGDTRVTEGVKMVDRAGQSMGEIQVGVEKVLSSIGDISSALKEQTSTSNLITKNIESITHMTEETKSVIEKVSASADNLEQLADELRKAVGQFKL